MNGGLRSLLIVDAKIGWGRVGFLLSLTIIAIAGVVLYRMLREINFEEVVDAMEAVENTMSSSPRCSSPPAISR